MTDDDGRNGFPSASSMARLAECTVSHALSRGLSSASSPDALAGTRKHAGCEHLNNGWMSPKPDLSESEWEEAKALVETSSEAFEGLAEKLDATLDRMFVEERVWWDGGKELKYSAKVDVAWILSPDHNGRGYTTEPLPNGGEVVRTYERGRDERDGDRGAIIDYKSCAFGEHDEPADNLQLRAQALAFAQTHDLQTVYVAIVQPGRKVEWCRYSDADLDAASIEIGDIVEAAIEGKGEPIPGESQCRYCPAAEHGVCPAVNATLDAMASGELAIPIEARSDDQIAAAREQAPAVRRLLDQIEAETRKRVEADPDAWERRGYVLAPSGVTRSITNPGLVYDRLVAMGIPHADAQKACSMSVTAVRKLAKKEAASVLEGAVEEKPKRPSLERVKALSATA